MASELFKKYFPDIAKQYDNSKEMSNYYQNIDLNTGWRGGLSLSEQYPETEITYNTNSVPTVEYTYSIPDFFKSKSVPVKDDSYYMQLAKDVIAQKYGNGQQRKQALGEDYAKVQSIVNQIMHDEQQRQQNLNPKKTIVQDTSDLSSDLSNLFSGISSGITTEGLIKENREKTAKIVNESMRSAMMNRFAPDYRQRYFRFQEGGQIPSQQDPVQIVIDGLNQNPQEMMQQLSQLSSQEGGKEQVNAILQEIAKRAQAGDQKAAQAVQVLQQAMNQAQSAKQGAKLQYIKHLKGICSDDEELVYMKKGGTMCPICQKKKEGTKMQNPKKKFFAKKGEKIGKNSDNEKETKSENPNLYIPSGEDTYEMRGGNYTGYMERIYDNAGNMEESIYTPTGDSVITRNIVVGQEPIYTLFPGNKRGYRYITNPDTIKTLSDRFYRMDQLYKIPFEKTNMVEKYGIPVKDFDTFTEKEKCGGKMKKKLKPKKACGGAMKKK